MKIKIPFTRKEVILDPVYEGLFFMLAVYALFAITLLLFAAFGAKILFTIMGVFILAHLFKTSEIKEMEVDNVKKEE